MILTSSSLAVFKGLMVLSSMSKVNGGHLTWMAVIGMCLTKRKSWELGESKVFHFPGFRWDEYPWSADQGRKCRSFGEFSISATVCSIRTCVGSARGKYFDIDQH